MQHFSKTVQKDLTDARIHSTPRVQHKDCYEWNVPAKTAMAGSFKFHIKIGANKKQNCGIIQTKKLLRADIRTIFLSWCSPQRWG